MSAIIQIPELLTILFAMLVSSVVVAYVLPRIVLVSLCKKLLDPYDKRKVHTRPTSRLGGVSFFFGIFISLMLTMVISNRFADTHYAFTDSHLLEICAVFILYVVGIYDDLMGVAYRHKFIVQFFTATLLVLGGTYLETFNGLFGVNLISSYVGIPLTIILCVFITNAFNLIDGIDGLASSLISIALFTFGALFIVSDQSFYALFAFTTLAALIPFLYCNIHHVRRHINAKIIMGDTGSLTLGFILSMMAVRLWNTAAFEAGELDLKFYGVLAYTVLIIPCFDVMRVMFHRYRTKKPLFMPDMNHFHHKLIACGCSHINALKIILAINGCFITLNIVVAFCLPFTFIVLIDAVAWIALHIYITKKIIARKS